jgi:hypothetical protein
VLYGGREGEILCFGKRSPIDIRSTVGKQACLVAFAGSCHAAGCKPTVQPGEGRLAKRLEAAFTLPEAARLAPLAKFLRQTTKQHAEGVSHISPGQAPKGATLPRVTGVGQPVPWANVSFPTVPGDPVVQSMGSCLMSRESSSQRRRQFVPSASGVPWNRPISIGLLSFQRQAPHSGPRIGRGYTRGRS